MPRYLKTTGNAPYPVAEENRPISMHDLSYAEGVIGPRRSKRNPTTFDRGVVTRETVFRPLVGQAVEFHRTAEDRKPAREIVTAKLMGDPPADLAHRRANPGLPNNRRK